MRLGEIHWYLLRAANVMHTRRYRKGKIGPHGFEEAPERTDFGREVGGDEINWWVFKKETDIDELGVQTQRALQSAQLLKQASVELRNQLPESYDDLLSTLRSFAEHHDAQIESLCEYVRWLETRDVLAPSILFAFRVWGSTRISDRWVGIDVESFEATRPAIIRELAMIVLGLRSDRSLAYDRARMDIGNEIYESRDPEEATDVEVPTAEVVVRTAWSVYGECATYFTCLRDSLRNVLLDVEKRIEQNQLINSDTFWRKFILKAVETKKAEPLLWDFKETLTMWKVTKDPEKGLAKVTFAEDVASLANAHGGVLVIGVRDRPREIVGLGDVARDVENRLKFASQVIARYIEYAGDLVSFHEVVIPSKEGEKVCLVVVVAQARTTVGVHDGQGKYTYPVRRGTGIDRVSASEIAKQKVCVENDNHDFVRELNQFVLDT